MLGRKVAIAGRPASTGIGIPRDCVKNFFCGRLLPLRLPDDKSGHADIALNLLIKLYGIERRFKRSWR
ncbi:hypothetical protein C8K63_115114 [Pseudomonas sp. GV085]|nr:hypothetical protein C8K63_115114 [Pseudomonas sp. GV085]